jgi:hypothetical protein
MAAPGKRRNDTTMRAALYARVSTLNGQHPEMQLADPLEHAARRGLLASTERKTIAPGAAAEIET